MHSYVVCHLDITFAIILLSCFATAPAHEHYLALKNVIKYLHHTKAWRIVYWRENPVDSLPAVPLDQPELDTLLPQFPTHQLRQLVGYIDAAYATDTLSHCLITGLVFCLA